MYTIHRRSTAAVRLRTGLLLGVAALLAITGMSLFPASSQAKTVVDTAACNTATTISQYDATFPDGTIKAGANPNFVVSGVSNCAAEMSVRIVAVTTAYTYDVTTNTYKIATTPGYPITETTKDMIVKPGVFKLSVKLADKPTDQVLQMRTEMRMYMSSSFDAAGKLMPEAVVLGVDTANWTQTNFITL